MADGEVRLQDGCSLAYAEFGHSTGPALLHFGSSRLEWGVVNDGT